MTREQAEKLARALRDAVRCVHAGAAGRVQSGGVAPGGDGLARAMGFYGERWYEQPGFSGVPPAEDIPDGEANTYLSIEALRQKLAGESAAAYDAGVAKLQQEHAQLLAALERLADACVEDGADYRGALGGAQDLIARIKGGG